MKNYNTVSNKRENNEVERKVYTKEDNKVEIDTKEEQKGREEDLYRRRTICNYRSNNNEKNNRFDDDKRMK